MAGRRESGAVGKNHPLHNLKFFQGDARTFPVSQPFDRVVSFNALHWIPEAEQSEVFETLAASPVFSFYQLVFEARRAVCT